MEKKYNLKILKNNKSFSFFNLIFNKNISIIRNADAEREFAEILKQDLLLLESKRDMNFIMNILVPILNAELDVPVCFHPYDSQSKRWLSEGKKI